MSTRTRASLIDGSAELADRLLGDYPMFSPGSVLRCLVRAGARARRQRDTTSSLPDRTEALPRTMLDARLTPSAPAQRTGAGQLDAAPLRTRTPGGRSLARR